MLYPIHIADFEAIQDTAIADPLTVESIARALAECDAATGLESVVQVIRNLQAIGAAAKKEADFFYRRHKVVEENVRLLKTQILQQLAAADAEKADAGEFIVRAVQNTFPNVVIVEEAAVPERFKQVITEIRVDRKAIGEEYKETGQVPEGIDVFFGEHLRIS